MEQPLALLFKRWGELSTQYNEPLPHLCFDWVSGHPVSMATFHQVMREIGCEHTFCSKPSLCFLTSKSYRMFHTTALSSRGANPIDFYRVGGWSEPANLKSSEAANLIPLTYVGNRIYSSLFLKTLNWILVRNGIVKSIKEKPPAAAYWSTIARYAGEKEFVEAAAAEATQGTEAGTGEAGAAAATGTTATREASRICRQHWMSGMGIR